MLFKDLSIETIKQSVSDLREKKIQGENKTREKLKDFYEDRQATFGYLYNYGFLDKDKKPLFPLTGYNLTKKVVDKISLIYKKPPERSIEGKETYAEWFNKHPEIHIALKTAERYKNLLHHVLFRPVYQTEFERWVYYIETSYVPHFIQGDPLHPVAYSIPVKQNVTQTAVKGIKDEEWLFLSNDYYFYHDNGGKIWFDNEYPDGTNPYGIIPAIEMISDFPVDEYGGDGMVSLVNANQAINISMANINMMLHHQAFDQPYITGVDETAAKTIVVAPNTAWTLPEGSIAGLLSYSPKILEAVEAIKFQIHSIAWTYNVSIDWSIEGTIASGVALKIKNMDLLEAREDDVELAKFTEKQLYEVLKTVQAFHRPPGEKQIGEGKLIVDFYDIDFPANVDEELKQRDWNIKNNIKTAIDYLIEENPDLDYKAAKKMYEENKLINNQSARALGFQQIAREGNNEE